jgi:Holliday junction resolvase
MSGKKSRDKGCRGERELAAELRRLFDIEARRGVQYHGGEDSPDVVADLPGVHIEVKRTERLGLYPAMKQAAADAGADKVPVVCHRANHQDWVAIVRLNDLPKLVSALENCKTKESQ